MMVARRGLVVKIESVILREIKNMSEVEAKKTLSSLLLNYEKIGKNDYTTEDFLKTLHNTVRSIVVDDMFFKCAPLTEVLFLLRSHERIFYVKKLKGVDKVDRGHRLGTFGSSKILSFWRCEVFTFLSIISWN